MNDKNKYIFLLCFIFSALFINAQEKIVHGFVTTFDSIPLVGVEVIVKSTKQVVLSDTNGYFAVGCNNTDKLRIKANGFYKQDIKLEQQTRIAAINLKLKPNTTRKTFSG